MSEAEDAVLRDRQTHRRGARQTGIEAAQDPRHDAMRHDDQRAVSGFCLSEPGADAAGEDLVGLAVGRREIPFVTPLVVEGARHQRGYVGTSEAVPRAKGELAQPVVKAQRLGPAEAIADDLGGVTGAAERAREEVGRARLR